MYVYRNDNFNFLIGDNIAECTAWTFLIILQFNLVCDFILKPFVPEILCK